jgi:hypothetical protein
VASITWTTQAQVRHTDAMPPSTFRDSADAVAKGLIAGVVGAAAMSATKHAEYHLRRRPPDTAPAAAAARLLGVQPVNRKRRQQFGELVHWVYGTAWGGGRGVLELTCLPGPIVTTAHLALIGGVKVLVLPRLRVVPGWREWQPGDVGLDAGHHLIYALTVSGVYRWLDRHLT